MDHPNEQRHEFAGLADIDWPRWRKVRITRLLKGGGSLVASTDARSVADDRGHLASAGAHAAAGSAICGVARQLCYQAQHRWRRPRPPIVGVAASYHAPSQPRGMPSASLPCYHADSWRDRIGILPVPKGPGSAMRRRCSTCQDSGATFSAHDSTPRRPWRNRPIPPSPMRVEGATAGDIIGTGGQSRRAGLLAALRRQAIGGYPRLVQLGERRTSCVTDCYLEIQYRVELRTYRQPGP